MPRNRDAGGSEHEELNLAPFMNMVVILIPLLLLSVVFLKIGVVNITAPKLSVGPPTDQKKKKTDEEPLNLTVGVGSNGFRVAATGAVLPPQGDCPETGPSICLADTSVQVGNLIKNSRQAYENGNEEEGEKLLRQASDAYDWMGLYNKLMEIKKEYPEETVINVSGDPNIPFTMVVRVLDVARYKLEEESYDNMEDFWAADAEVEVKGGKEIPQPLFNDPVLAVAK